MHSISTFIEQRNGNRKWKRNLKGTVTEKRKGTGKRTETGMDLGTGTETVKRQEQE